MRKFFALARTAKIETLAQPLTAILFFVASLSVHLAGVFHFHQFGESARLVRECGFSALFVFGVLFASSAIIHTFGRELSDGTGALALVHEISPLSYLTGKLWGVVLAFVLFAVGILSATVLAAVSATKGAALALENPEVRLWIPGVALGVCGPILAFLMAGMLNRFACIRFCLWACRLTVLSQVLAVLVLVPNETLPLVLAYLPSWVTLFMGCVSFLALTAALSARFSSVIVMAGVVLAGVSAFVCPLRAIVPAFAQFWTVDALANGGVWNWANAAFPLTTACALIIFWLVAGSWLLARRELA